MNAMLKDVVAGEEGVVRSEVLEFLNNARARKTAALGQRAVALKKAHNLTSRDCLNLFNSKFSDDEDATEVMRMKGRTLQQTANDNTLFIAGRPHLSAVVQEVLVDVFGFDWDKDDLAFTMIVVSTRDLLPC